jgi:ribose transport system substrate-binding protein
VLALAVSACGGGEESAATTEAAAADTAAAVTTAAEPSTEEAATGAAESNEPIKLAFFTFGPNSYVESTIDQLKKTAEEQGVPLDFTLFDPNFDAQKQYSQVQDAVTSEQFDAFVIMPVDFAGIVPAVQEATAAGIPVVAYDFPIGDDLSTVDPQYEGIVGSTLRPATEQGEVFGQMITEACEGRDPCNVVYLIGLLEGAHDAIARGVVEQVDADNEHITVVAEAECGYAREPAFTAMQDIIQANEQIDVVATAGDQCALGAEQALTDAGIEVGAEGVRILGVGASEPGVEAVRAGRWWATAMLLPRDEGRIAFEFVNAAVRGEEIPDPGIDAAEASDWPLILSQANADEWADFQAQWVG